MRVGGAREPAEVADARMGQDDPRPGVTVELGEQVTPQRRDAAAGVHEDGHAGLGREREDRAQRRMVEGEVLGARMQLEPARARSQAALRLGPRVLARVEPREGHQAAGGVAGLGQHAVVGLGVAARLVHREDDRARPREGERLEQRAGRAGVAVGVVGARVGVRVEEADAGELTPEGLEPGKEGPIGVHVAPP